MIWRTFVMLNEVKHPVRRWKRRNKLNSRIAFGAQILRFAQDDKIQLHDTSTGDDR